MELKTKIYQLRMDQNLSQERFAEMLEVSRQAVQKWENGTAQPGLEHVIRMAKQFHISLDRLLCERDLRMMEEVEAHIKPAYSALHSWQKYSHDLDVEYQQCLEEGIDVRPYEALFSAAQKMPDDEYRDAVSDVLFQITRSAPVMPGYPYREPSDYEGICAERDGFVWKGEMPDLAQLRRKIEGAWYGRIAGCLLGKPLEGIRRGELIPFLKETGNFPMHRYLQSSDITPERRERYQFHFRGNYADTISAAPVDDDTNYTVLYQRLVEEYSCSFTPQDVAKAWLAWQPKDAYCTAERVAFCNFVNGFFPPQSAYYKNHYREWIGAQIRGDYFGYINPGDPEKAAEMAWRDACISHVKNGIYGEMLVAAMLAAAACCQDMETVIRVGLSQIPAGSRLYEELSGMLADYRNGVGQEEAFRKITERYDDRSGHDWCHTISNARIVVAALLYGKGNFGESIGLAVQTGFDTDCNGATVGSILGMMYGIKHIDSSWTEPLHGKLATSIFGVGTVEIQSLIDTTLRHISSAK
ncbi:MAG: ADP-ribosylglycohydrolase family protein [Candidatus Merdivicinus sp.]|jgi:transcriptional regulator with XRE-family HTH domain/ADP-ribosylglycohydrolase